MTTDKLDGATVHLKENGFKYKLTRVLDSELQAKNLLFEKVIKIIDDVEKSYTSSKNAKPYGENVKDIRTLLTNASLCKNQTEFANLIGVKNYETVSRVESSIPQSPKGKRKKTLETAVRNLRDFTKNKLKES